MARYRSVGLFGRFRHRSHHGGPIRAKDNQAFHIGLDMVPVAYALAGTVDEVVALPRCSGRQAQWPRARLLRTSTCSQQLTIPPGPGCSRLISSVVATTNDRIAATLRKGPVYAGPFALHRDFLLKKT